MERHDGKRFADLFCKDGVYHDSQFVSFEPLLARTPPREAHPRGANAAEELSAETPYAPKMMGCHPKLRPQLFPKRAQPAS